MKAIQTKYHGPGNVRGARISADDGDGNRVFISYPDELSGEACHRAAADALCLKMGWKGPLVGGGLKNGWVFCFAEASPEVVAMREALKPLIFDVSTVVTHNRTPGNQRTVTVHLLRGMECHVSSARTALQPFTR